MKSILVTGATGNLGRAVVRAIRNKGMTVRAAGRDPKKPCAHQNAAAWA